MNKKSFEELLESVKQGAEILKGKMKPAEIVTYEVPDVKGIRTRLNLSQNKFASILGISSGTLKNWEQGIRQPKGRARVLIAVAEKHPEAVLDTVLSLAIKKDTLKPKRGKAKTL